MRRIFPNDISVKSDDSNKEISNYEGSYGSLPKGKSIASKQNNISYDKNNLIYTINENDEENS